MPSRLPLLLLLAVSLGNPAFSKIYQWTDENGNTHFSDRPPPNPTSTLEAVESNGSKSAPRIQQADIDSVLELKSMLRQHRFGALNDRLSSLDEAIKASIEHEKPMVTAYNVFAVSDESIETHLNRWVRTTPDSYVPYLARANFHYTMGWKARGYDSASNTAEEQLSGMSARFDQARQDIHQAMSLNNQPIFNYLLLTSIETTEGNQQAARAMMTSGLDIYPLSYSIRDRYLRALEPRWGGSYEAMSDYIRESQGQASGNSRLKLLKGHIESDMADREMLSRNYASAATRYSRALVHGDNAYLYYQRAKAYLRQTRYELALSDIKKAVAMVPHSAFYQARYSRVLMQMGRLDEAREPIALAKKLDSSNRFVASQSENLARRYYNTGIELSRSQDYQSAIEHYAIAAELAPYHADTFYSLAANHKRVHQLEPALDNIQRAIQLDPDNLSYVKLADSILTRNKQWDVIISYWNDFIERNPDVTEAYFQRAGTHYHNGNLDAALADMKRADDMGDPRAAELYHRLGGQ